MPVIAAATPTKAHWNAGGDTARKSHASFGEESARSEPKSSRATAKLPSARSDKGQPATPTAATPGPESARSRAALEDDFAESEGSMGEKVHMLDKGFLSSFFGIAVVVNVAFIGLDTDLRAKGAGAQAEALMFFVEAVFFGIFFVELMMRVHADRCPKFLRRRWNWLDGLLVLLSALGLAVELFMGDAGALQSGENVRIMRLLKIARVVRLLRLLRVFRYKAFIRAARGLILMLYAIHGAMKSLGWTAFLFLCCTYLGAILTTEFIGLANEDNDPLIEEWYGDLQKSMFTLLQMSTLEDWSTITRHTSEKHGVIWDGVIILYVMATNMVLMNVVLGSLVENVFCLTANLRQVQAGEIPDEDAESWMKTPSSLASSEDERDLDDDEIPVTLVGSGGASAELASMAGTAQAFAGGSMFSDTRATLLMMTDLFDSLSTYTGVEGMSQKKLVTRKSMQDGLLRHDVQTKLTAICPVLQNSPPEEMERRLWNSCPRRQDEEGLNRQELVESCMAICGELSMNHFVVISQALQKLETRVTNELNHLDKHQRKMNRRLLKMRHRLRCVYHYNGAPRRMLAAMSKHQTDKLKAGLKLNPVDEVASFKPKKRINAPDLDSSNNKSKGSKKSGEDSDDWTDSSDEDWGLRDGGDGESSESSVGWGDDSDSDEKEEDATGEKT